MASSGEQEEESALGGPVFSPPLYKQRYNEVIEIARKVQAKKVVDMGCAECKLLRKLKAEQYVEQLYGVDIDLISLRLKEHIVHPLTTDYLMPRSNPLQVTLMQGSIAEPDGRLRSADLVSCVEVYVSNRKQNWSSSGRHLPVIEHLDPDVLDKVPPSIFGALEPKTVVITTPNAEYNVLFPGLSGFRHHDHRFEWTRAEFKEWCSVIVSTYPGYSVEFGGVGDPPRGREEVGFCSQMAVFTRDSSAVEEITMDTPYTIISSAVHPSAPVISPEQKLCSEAEYYLNVLLRARREQLLCDDSYGSLEPDDKLLIKLTDLLNFPKIAKLCSSGEEIREALRLSSVVELNEPGDCAVYWPSEEESDSSASDSESDA